ncbi:hypothetical protein [Halococcus agarilyticus]|uniref:hypothetical protein n=1 Tax=Halococcus agarilyticus TaxID=1232219 RepID=UPI000677F47C|nr:hypothetical protein [Halococcus agarilyticus]
MTLRERLADEESLRLLTRTLQLALVGIVCYGAVTLNVGLVVNAGVSLGVTFLPAVLERKYRLPMNAGLVLWITGAVSLHAIGALGPYEWFGWYDSVTHTLSASVVAGAGYASARALDVHSAEIEIPSRYMPGFILTFVLAFGVLWEVLEFGLGGAASLVGGEAVLAQYGVDDIVFDLLFNAVGAILVAALGTQRLRGVASALADRLGTHTGQ